MGRKLLIVESPAKIKTLSKFLDKDFMIMSTFGHIKDLPPREVGITLDRQKQDIALQYVPIEDKAKVIKEICRAAQNSSEIFLASDPDREGEIISWHIGQEVKNAVADKAAIHRITFNEITQPAVTQAIQNKSSIDMKLVAAQQARRVLDRWVGYEVSPILWKKIQKGLSAGRVQSAALLIICTRDKEIEDFRPEEFWSIHGKFGIKTSSFEAELARISNKKIQIKNKKDADKILADIKKQSYTVTSIKEQQRKKNPLPPFMTSTLQQDAFNKLGFSVDKTMSLAQKLYEGMPVTDGSSQALITYMRTDSLRISDTALKAARDFISTSFGGKYLPKKANQYTKKAAQDAHEAIRPIDTTITPEIAQSTLPRDAARLYSLIWKRFVASQMTPAEYQLRQVNIEGGKYLFRLSGSTLMFDGFLRVYEVEEDSATGTKIPKAVQKDVALDLKDATGKQHFTQPPPRYTQASLVKEMEKQGIGRPSTYAATLSTLQKRNYVTVTKKKFAGTELGRSVNNLLTEHLPDIINLKFTAKMEEDLDRIAHGEIKRNTVLFDFYDKFQDDLKKFAENVGVGKVAQPTGLKCPDCKNELVIRFGKKGEFIGCSNFPDCTFTSPFTRDEDGVIHLVEATQEKPVESEIKCPNCGKNLVERHGKYGAFLACPGFPECKYIHQKTLDTPCPQCGGTIAERTWRGGKFWGCKNYPKCKFAIFGDIIEESCPTCKHPYLISKTDKEKGTLHTCPKPECSYEKQV